jgi:hypothetical protein
MKRVLMIGLVLLLTAGAAQAQSIVQAGEQLALDIEKLSELKGILKDMYTAYEIIDKGYTDVKNIVEGNFNLHKAFLDALLAVSPAVQDYSKVERIISAESQILAEYKTASRQLAGSGRFSISELDYTNGVYANLLNRSATCVNELVMLLTADELRMSDADRLAGIDRVDTDISSQLRLLRMFNSGLTLQAGLRAREAGDINTIKLLYDLSN